MNDLNAYFNNKKILIIGGTGSIGSQILDSLITFSPKVIKVFSRDEYKQYKLRYKYNDYSNIDYCLGDVRDLEAVSNASYGFDLIFHCAALKHVPPSEEMPEEFVKTNILGSLNVKKSAIINRIPTTISISSDKAVDPCNLMGLTKAVQEKIFSSHNLRERMPNVKFVNVRFGNVIGTQGSLFPIIYHQIINKKPITITHPDMTRFFMSQKEAVDLIFWATMYGNDGDIIIKKMKSIKIINLVKNFLDHLKMNKLPIKYIGIRLGEKVHEYLITEDNLYRLKEKDDYYIVSPYSDNNNIYNNSFNQYKNINRNKFFSNSKDNFMTNKEITKYIKNFIKDLKQKDHIL